MLIPSFDKDFIYNQRDVLMRILGILAVVTAACGLIACSEYIVESTETVTAGAAVTIPATFSAIQAGVFDKSCNDAGCHDGSVSPDLRAASNSYNNIVEVASSQRLNYIQPGDAARSYLFVKMANLPGIRYSRMPISGVPIPAAVLDSIATWIDNGAANN